jgi:hypothetical protein
MPEVFRDPLLELLRQSVLEDLCLGMNLVPRNSEGLR